MSIESVAQSASKTGTLESLATTPRSADGKRMWLVELTASLNAQNDNNNSRSVIVSLRSVLVGLQRDTKLQILMMVGAESLTVCYLR
jgi:hypothetical protein